MFDLALVLAASVLAAEFPPAIPIAQPGLHAPTTAPASVTLNDLGDGRWWATFTYGPPEGARRCFLAGDFNGWSSSATEIERVGGDFRVSVALDEGVRTYKFVVETVRRGTQWHHDPRNDDRADDGHGGANSVLRLGTLANLSDVAVSSRAVRGDGAVDAIGLWHDADSALSLQARPSGTLVRFRTLAHDVEIVELVSEGDLRARLHPVLEDGRFEWWEATIEGIAPDIAPDIAPGIAPGLAPGIAPGIAPGDRYTFVFSDGGRAMRSPDIYSWPMELNTMRTPDWARDAVWYQIMVDRFRNGNSANDPDPVRPWTSEWYSSSEWEGQDGQSFYEWFVFSRLYGGDFQGLRSKLGYLDDLGVNALYLNPVFQAPTHHKYDTQSYVHIDQHYGQGRDYRTTADRENLLDPASWTFNGSDREFLSFLKDAKARGMRVIVDGVFNHVGVAHDAFADVRKRGQSSPYADWFQVTSWDPFEYEGWAGFGGLPIFRKSEDGLASQAVKDHIFAITRRWMDPDGDGDPSDGIDGWRLDVPNEVALPFWEEWCALVREINPDAYISGEIWNRAGEWLDGRTFDAVMNYPFAEIAINWIGDKSSKITATVAERRFAELRLEYPEPATAVLQNLVDSHDTDRLVSKIHNPDRPYDTGNREQDDDSYDGSKPPPAAYRRARLIALLQMTYVGAPMVYYGDEVGMWGADDPTNRKPMLWKDLEPYHGSAENHVMDDHHAFYRAAIQMRRAHSALRRGSLRTLLVDDARDVWIFMREDGAEQLIVALNASDVPQRVLLEGLGEGWAPAFGHATTFPEMLLDPVDGQVWARAK